MRLFPSGRKTATRSFPINNGMRRLFGLRSASALAALGKIKFLFHLDLGRAIVGSLIGSKDSAASLFKGVAS